MELKTKLNEYKGSNVSLQVSEDLKKIAAYSYSWWQFVTTDKVGNIIFNNYTYSNSTSGHQSDVHSKLRWLGLSINLELRKTNKSLGSLKDAIKDEIKCYKYEIKVLNEQIKKPRTHKRKNEERKKDIKNKEYRIKDLENYLKNYIDKQLIPVKTIKFKFRPDQYTEQSEIDSTVASFAKYFKKPNGKLQKNELTECLNKYASMYAYHDAPENLDNLKNLFNLKQSHIQSILVYKHLNDVNNMIPNDNTPEYLQLKRWIKTNDINRDNLNLLSLEKLHTYQINKQNRKNYTPSEPNYFPVNQKLLQIKNIDGIKIIETDRDLRTEGKKQSHCIGSKYYIDRCKEGYNALNYKGYTFFLTPDLRLVETHGKHNRSTPYELQLELSKILNQDLSGNAA